MPDTFTPTVLNAPLCELGEGPTYDRYTDTAWWFDILNSKLYEHAFGAGVTKQHDLPFAASALARVDEARQLVFTERGLYLRDVASGGLSLHCAIEADNPVTRSNDARVHPSGAFWLGTMGWKLEKEAGSIYWFYKGELRKLYNKITISNAICFSPDGTIGYFADTALRKVMRVPLDAATGLPIGEPVVFLDNFSAGNLASNLGGNPDGAVVDAQGNVWVALWGGAQVAGFAPDGSFLQSIIVSATQPTCPVFVGQDASKMLVTSAWGGLNDDERSHQQAGATFVIDLPFKGRFEPAVKIA